MFCGKQRSAPVKCCGLHENAAATLPNWEVYNCAEGASFSATPGFKWLVSVCTYTRIFCDFYRLHMRRLHPVFPLLAFQLGFSGIPEKHEKTEKSYLGEASRRTPFWDPFLSLFLKKLRFVLEGLVKVRHLVLVRPGTTSAQPCPAGQSSVCKVM